MRYSSCKTMVSMKRLVIISVVTIVTLAICIRLYKVNNYFVYSCQFFSHKNYMREEVEIVGLSKTPMSINLTDFTRNLAEIYYVYKYEESGFEEFEKLEELEVSDTLKDILFQHCYNDMNPIDYEDDYRVRAREFTKKNTTYYNLGTVNVSNQFESHLIFSTSEGGRYDNRILYMLNVAQNQLKSIAEIAYFSNSGARYYIHEVKDTKFLLKTEYTSIDQLQPRYVDVLFAIFKFLGVKDYMMINTPFHCCFSFDKDGYVVVESDYCFLK